MEELQTRHRKEQRDLQSRITQKKKQASKKTRKGVNEECERLEAELKEQQKVELEELEGGAVNGAEGEEETPSPQRSEEPTSNANDEANGTANAPETTPPADRDPAANGDPIGPSQAKKPNRQKARLARRAAEQDEQARAAADEAAHLPDLKKQERERMLASMRERGLRETEIRADGHCLYSAVADQLGQLENNDGDNDNTNKPATIPYKTVRATAADYIQAHPDDFAPFVEEALGEHVRKVRDTAEWGGQLELLALARAYALDIHVLQDFGRVERIEGGSGRADRVAWLGYYRHGFGLGEHYNSLRKIG